MNPRATSSIVAALPSSRMLLLFGGIVLLSESSALATILFVAAGLSFAATLLLATKLYRASGRRPQLDLGVCDAPVPPEGRVSTYRKAEAAGQMRARGIQPSVDRAARFEQRQDGGSGRSGTRRGREAPIRSATAST